MLIERACEGDRHTFSSARSQSAWELFTRLEASALWPPWAAARFRVEWVHTLDFWLCLHVAQSVHYQNKKGALTPANPVLGWAWVITLWPMEQKVRPCLGWVVSKNTLRCPERNWRLLCLTYDFTKLTLVELQFPTASFIYSCYLLSVFLCQCRSVSCDTRWQTPSLSWSLISIFLPQRVDIKFGPRASCLINRLWLNEIFPCLHSRASWVLSRARSLLLGNVLPYLSSC